jgi:hypothetical protein
MFTVLANRTDSQNELTRPATYHSSNIVDAVHFGVVGFEHADDVAGLQ